MKERPILFSAPMVRTILEGRKTVTRRVLKFNAAGRAAYFGKQWHPDDLDIAKACPYGQPGDRLWVRETWRTDSGLDMQKPSSFCAWPVKYLADNAARTCGALFGNTNGKTRVSIHMPRWASRITLEVTGVRVERLQDITPAQILAEGVLIHTTPEGQALIDISTKHGPAHFLPKLRGASTDDLLRAHWAALWTGINGIDSWNANLWVWVVEFRRVTP